MNLTHILFPVDFSKRSSTTAPFVQAMARLFGAKVTLLHAIQPILVMGSVDGGLPVEFDMDALRAAVNKQLDGWLKDGWNGIPVDRVVQEGEPASATVHFARKNGVGLIMMPSHGYGPFRSMLLGSVTSKVLHDTSCPVWTDVHLEELKSQKHLAIRSIVCAVDQSQDSRALVRWAADFAAAAKASLRIVHSVGAATTRAERHFGPEFPDALREQARPGLEAMLKEEGIDAPLCISTGNIAEDVREEASLHAADLVIIGRGALHEKLGHLRTNANAITRQSPCPVLSV